LQIAAAIGLRHVLPVQMNVMITPDNRLNVLASTTPSRTTVKPSSWIRTVVETWPYRVGPESTAMSRFGIERSGSAVAAGAPSAVRTRLSTSGAGENRRMWRIRRSSGQRKATSPSGEISGFTSSGSR